jgi:hypothetical protein
MSPLSPNKNWCKEEVINFRQCEAGSWRNAGAKEMLKQIADESERQKEGLP